MKIITIKGMKVQVAEKSFSVNNSAFIWLGNDNQEETIRSLIDNIYCQAQKDIQNNIKNILGIK